jgi:hypothetical protein
MEAENFLVAVQMILLILTTYRLRRVAPGRCSYSRDLFIITNFVAVGLPAMYSSSFDLSTLITAHGNYLVIQNLALRS